MQRNLLKENEEKERIKTRAELHVNQNLTLLLVSFTIFTFVVTINEKILHQDQLLALQLVISIPLFMSSLFARANLATYRNSKLIDDYGFICFILAYSFLTNSIGILLASYVSIGASMIFFISNIVLAIGYSLVIVKEGKSTFVRRVYKDSFFVISTIILGILPALKVY